MTKKLKLSAKALEEIEKTNLLAQCKTEFRLSKDALTTKWSSWHTYLKLYNNSKRDKEAVGNNLLYTLFNTLLAYLYFDKLQVSFNPRESGDIDKCELATNAAKFDYALMNMPQIQYDWLWDALFFGIGYLYVGGMVKQVPQIEVIDPFTVYIDPLATEISNTRFIALERQMMKWEMKKKGFENIESLQSSKQDTQTERAEQARKDAKNEVNPTEEETYENKEYVVLEWFTIRDGKKVHFFTDFNCSILFTPVKKLVYKDHEWPFVIKRFSPIPHELSGLSVPDLLEDKQRASAVLINLGLAMEKSKLYPQYLYDRNAIPNINDLKNFAFNKFIPTEPGGRAMRDIISPLQQQSITNSTNVIYEMIKDFAQRTVGTPDSKQGFASKGKRTATELQLTQISADTRNSLAAKLFTLSEVNLWQKWLNRYKQFKSLVKDKIIRIQGALGVKFEQIDLDTFDFNTDPDVIIESANVSAQQKMIDKQSLVELSKVIIDQESTISSKRYYKRRLLQLSDFEKDEINQILPPTFDELRAMEENKILAKGKLPEIEPYDDHYTHITIHNTVADSDKVKANKMAHIQAHKQAFLDDRQEEKRMALEQKNAPQGTPAKQPNINGSIEGFISEGKAPFEKPQVPMSENPMNPINPTQQ